MKIAQAISQAILTANTEADLSLLNIAEAVFLTEVIACNSDNQQAQHDILKADKVISNKRVQYDI